MPISSIKFQVNENFNLTIGMSQTNIPYFMVVGNGCYAYKDGDFLVIDDTKSQETCRIKLETEIYSAEQVLSGMYRMFLLKLQG